MFEIRISAVSALTTLALINNGREFERSRSIKFNRISIDGGARVSKLENDLRFGDGENFVKIFLEL